MVCIGLEFQPKLGGMNEKMMSCQLTHSIGSVSIELGGKKNKDV